MNSPELQRGDGFWIGRFQAMASPCELLMEVDDEALARRMTNIAAREALRVEAKFSRYRKDNIIHRINTSGGRPVEVDAETANLLDYADQCHKLSEGRFDITSGVLREVWRFAPDATLPSAEAVEAVRRRVGWQRVTWQRPVLTLPEGMEVDLGGIGKEYAVERAAQLVSQHTDESIALNFGGDLKVTKPRRGDRPWVIGIEDPRRDGTAIRQVSIRYGALATSGDARRYIEHEGIRYGHILDPRSGWPVKGAPASVTVWAETCMEAGMLATFAILSGPDAEAFLKAQDVPYWIS